MKAFAALLIAAGILLAVISVPVVWLHEVVFDTEDYVATVAPLSEDPVIKDAVAEFASDQFLLHSNAEQLAQLALPEDAEFMADPLLGALDGYIYEQVRDELDSVRFDEIWMETNRGAHDSVLQLMLGRPGSIQTSGDRIVLDLGLLLDDIRQSLIQEGLFVFEAIDVPEGAATFIIFQSPELTRARQALRFLDSLSSWLPLAALVALSAAALIWRRPGRILAWAGLGIAAGMLAILLLLSLVRGEYLDTISRGSSVDAAAAAAFFDVMSSSLKDWLWTVFAVSVITMLLSVAAGIIYRWR